MHESVRLESNKFVLTGRRGDKTTIEFEDDVHLWEYTNQNSDLDIWMVIGDE